MYMSIALQSAGAFGHGGGAARAPITAVAQAVRAPGLEQGAKVPDPADAGDRRLVIEQDKPTGTFVYKTVDRISGDLLYQYPCEEMLKLREDPGYVSGAVVSKSA